MSGPHCLKKEACEAKGEGHCRLCAGKASAKRLHSDPQNRIKSSVAMRARNTDPAFRERIREGIAIAKVDPALRAARVEQARRNSAAIAQNPEIIERRIEAIKSSERHRAAVRKQAEAYARRVGVPFSLLDDFRRLRGRQFTKTEAVGILARSYPVEFSAMRETAVAKLRRVIHHRATENCTALAMGDPVEGRSALAIREVSP